MEPFKLVTDENGRQTLEVPLRGSSLLERGMYNKGTAFTKAERRLLELEGLLPPETNDLDAQARRIQKNLDPTFPEPVNLSGEGALELYVGLSSLQDRNEVLYYYLLARNVDRYLPIVYTPTVGRACQEYSHIFRRGRGLWITPDHRGRIQEILENAPYEDVRLIVATDNEGILGLGDLGAGGMGIPIGKLALYTLGAGIHPSKCLPISIDVGTDRQELRDDPLYLGYSKPRLRGEAYYELIDEFVLAVKAKFPNALLQWEDFSKQNAFTLLDDHVDDILSFNDDIQGTAAVSLAGIMAANRVVGKSMRDHRVVILGAGAAGIGIARQLRDAMKNEGLSGDELTSGIALLDSRGLLVDDREIREEYKRDFAWPQELAQKHGLGDPADRQLEDVIAKLKATVLIGTSGQPGAFTENVVSAMDEASERPMIFPFSNPTSMSEGKPEDILKLTEGRALVATGSPFAPVEVNGKVIHVGQGNNVYIFPGLGLGALAVRSRKVSEKMVTAAANALAAQVDQADLDRGALYPPMNELRQITRKVAHAVALCAIEEGFTDVKPEELDSSLDELMWTPRYPDELVAG